MRAVPVWLHLAWPSGPAAEGKGGWGRRMENQQICEYGVMSAPGGHKAARVRKWIWRVCREQGGVPGEVTRSKRQGPKGEQE